MRRATEGIVSSMVVSGSRENDNWIINRVGNSNEKSQNILTY